MPSNESAADIQRDIYLNWMGPSVEVGHSWRTPPGGLLRLARGREEGDELYPHDGHDWWRVKNQNGLLFLVYCYWLLQDQGLSGTDQEHFETAVRRLRRDNSNRDFARRDGIRSENGEVRFEHDDEGGSVDNVIALAAGAILLNSPNRQELCEYLIEHGLDSRVWGKRLLPFCPDIRALLEVGCGLHPALEVISGFQASWTLVLCLNPRTHTSEWGCQLLIAAGIKCQAARSGNVILRAQADLALTCLLTRLSGCGGLVAPFEHFGNEHPICRLARISSIAITPNDPTPLEALEKLFLDAAAKLIDLFLEGKEVSEEVRTAISEEVKQFAQEVRNACENMKHEVQRTREHVDQLADRVRGEVSRIAKGILGINDPSSPPERGVGETRDFEFEFELPMGRKIRMYGRKNTDRRIGVSVYAKALGDAAETRLVKTTFIPPSDADLERTGDFEKRFIAPAGPVVLRSSCNAPPEGGRIKNRIELRKAWDGRNQEVDLVYYQFEITTPYGDEPVMLEFRDEGEPD